MLTARRRTLRITAHREQLLPLAGGASSRQAKKFGTGEYGLDEETGEPIGFGRLSALPWARFAASTQEAHERR